MHSNNTRVLVVMHSNNTRVLVVMHSNNTRVLVVMHSNNTRVLVVKLRGLIEAFTDETLTAKCKHLNVLCTEENKMNMI